jgi:16S rRNA (cytidine1402-2'-O)-methyltransferase
VPLFVVATPIGNLEEASPRMCRVLAEADLVLCEDTRRTRTLFAAMDLTAPKLVSCHAHNEGGRLAAVTDRLSQGETIALVSDAGAPGISDPGGPIVAAAHAAQVPVHVVGGPSSVVAAVSVSGFPASPFHFLGFLPRKSGPMAKAIVTASHLPGILVFLESGRRVGGVIAQLALLLPDREAVICRELTKKFEEITRGPLSALPVTEQRGEVVLVVGPGSAVETAVREVGPNLKTIAAALAERWGCKKSEAYAALVVLEQDRD